MGKAICIKNIFLILLLAFAKTNHGQSNASFPASKAVWTIGVYDVYGSFHYRYYYHILSDNTDTTINNIIYKKIFYTDSANVYLYKGALREDSDQKIFFTPKDSVSEKLLYDFSANIGDTVRNVYSTWNVSEPAHNEPVLDVDSISINGHYHKRLLLPLNFYWLEGIGSTGGLFESTYGGTFSVVYKLECFSSNDSLVYSTNNGVCNPTFVSEINNKPVQAIIYPNPSNGEIHLQINLEPVQKLFFKLYTTNGICVYQIPFYSSDATISINRTGLSSGIYYYELTNNSKLVKRDKIIIAP